MNASRIFIDTNILIYAYDKRDPSKHQAAHALMSDLIGSGSGVISDQVVREFYNAALHKLKILKAPEIKSIFHRVLHPLLVRISDPGFYQRGAELYEKYSLSFYDALIIQAAVDLDCNTLYSEDLQNGMKFGSLTVKNPF
ncbi:MAG TPA: PIN domain-containing protein [Candidatus Limnocylindria bacterium]|nr:PIN domain-containing protein [Candidatus Limnocylindria bacterium]